MAYQCMKYRLTAQGTVPDFLYLGEDGVGGVFGVADATPSPRELLMIAIAKDGASGDFEVIATKAESLSRGGSSISTANAANGYRSCFLIWRSMSMISLFSTR